MMMSLFCLARKRLLEETQANIGSTIAFAPEYADDGFSGGAVDEILKLFQEELRLAEEYGLRYDLNNCTLYLLAGDGFRGDVSAFQALGVRVDAICNIQILKAPVCGSPEFLPEWCQNKKSDFERAFQALEDLDQKDVVFHLLQTCMGWFQLNCLGRTAPRCFLVPLLDWYDARYREVFEVILGKGITDIQWLQATLPSISGSLELTTERISLGDQIFGRADLAYVIAYRTAAALIEALVPSRLDHSRIDWAPAVQRLIQIFPIWQAELENAVFRSK